MNLIFEQHISSWLLENVCRLSMKLNTKALSFGLYNKILNPT